MKLKVRAVKFKAGRPIVLLHEKDAQKLAVHTGERIEVSSQKKRTICVVDIATGLFPQGEIALSEEIRASIDGHNPKFVTVKLVPMPESTRILQQKPRSRPYTKEELRIIMRDIVSNALTEAEIAYFVSGVYHYGMKFEETVYLTQAICDTGQRLRWSSKIVADKHSIGGIAGNRTTPIVVSICAAAGITIPKTSSRAITSGAGTADVIESIARVDFPIEKLKEIVRKTGACLAWGGSLGLAPADDKLIQVEKMLNLDPEPQLLASILAKKLAVGSTHVLIDIPYGEGAKVSKIGAEKLKAKFIRLGKALSLTVHVVLTDGKQPIGNGMGPILEIRDVLRVLRNDNPPKDLRRKCLMLAGALIEMVGKTKKGKGLKEATRILDSGAALRKFEEIITAQGGSLNHLPNARFTYVIKAAKPGTVTEINNKSINALVRSLGSPQDKTAGIYLHVHLKDKVHKGSPVVTLHAESEEKIEEAKLLFAGRNPVKVT